MSSVQPAKTERIDVRTSGQVKNLLQEAAKARHKNISEFLLDAGIAMAHETLAEQRLFLLTDEQWAEFQAALDRPAKDIPELRKLMTEPGVLG
jgi:uncharacterized protein (DUF1778 family)